nr:MAG TPA: phosphoprotein [Caudoviricetes sp.]
MIIKEFYRTRKDGVNLYRTYSDSKLMIKQVETGNVYAEAIDVESAVYTYEETDIPIEEDESTEMRLDAVERAIDTITGKG